MRTDLSRETWIEDRWVYTTSGDVAAAWMKCIDAERRLIYEPPTAHGVPHPGPWFSGCEVFDPGIGKSWVYRIPLTAAREVYQYREGEPGCTIVEMFHGYTVVLQSTKAPRTRYQLHRRAAGVCDTAVQFKALYDAIQEE